MKLPLRTQSLEKSPVSRSARRQRWRAHWYCDSLTARPFQAAGIPGDLNMNVGGIDQSRILAMMEQLKAAATKPGAQVQAPLGAPGIGGPPKVDFADALKNTISQVSDAQQAASSKSRAFALGDDSVNLSDVMIASQKASIAFQATVQVRNKVVSAYQEIMNMQV
jgi:flagellar hook-basal body complex protein FliE